MATQICVIAAIARPSHDHRTSVCTLQPFLIPFHAKEGLSASHWLNSPVATQLGLPLKVCNLSTATALPIAIADTRFSSFRVKIDNDDAVLNHIANRLFADLDTTSTGFGEAKSWRFWDTALIARTDGKPLDIEFLHAMDHFLRLRIQEIRAHTATFTSAKRRNSYLQAIKDSSFTAQNMAATWEEIKADGIAKGYEKYQGMGNPFRPAQAMRRGVERIAGVGEPRTCAYCGGTSLWLRACGGCGEVWYCGTACEGHHMVPHQGQCGGMVVET